MEGKAMKYNDGNSTDDDDEVVILESPNHKQNANMLEEDNSDSSSRDAVELLQVLNCIKQDIENLRLILNMVNTEVKECKAIVDSMAKRKLDHIEQDTDEGSPQKKR